ETSSSGTSPSVTNASGFANSGCVSTTASTTAKIDAPAPSVSDSVRTAAIALAGARRRLRRRWRTSTSIRDSVVPILDTFGPDDDELLSAGRPRLPETAHEGSKMTRRAVAGRLPVSRPHVHPSVRKDDCVGSSEFDTTPSRRDDQQELPFEE